MADTLLTVRGLTKTFPGTIALSDVDLTLSAKSVTCAVGHNGSGKSTLVKVLAGIYKPDAGEITTSFGDDAGIHFIHQDLGLIDELTTIENLNLARGTGLGALASPRRTRERREVEHLLAQFGVRLDVTAPLRTLTAAQRTMVAIARAMSRWPDERQILVLDEPTATLHDKEAEVVLDATRRIADRGAAVLFISHRLDEVERIADQVVVLRDGKVIADQPRGKFTAHTLVELIAGHEIEASTDRTVDRGLETAASTPLLEIRGLDGTNLRVIDLDVRAGEIVGVSGVLGSGVEETPWHRLRSAHPSRGPRHRRRHRGQAQHGRRHPGRAELRPGRPPPPCGVPVLPRTREPNAPQPRFAPPARGGASTVAVSVRRPDAGSTTPPSSPDNLSACSHSSAAVTSRRSCCRGGCGPPQRSSCSKSRPKASTSAPKAPSTTWSARPPLPGPPSLSRPPTPQS